MVTIKCSSRENFYQNLGMEHFHQEKMSEKIVPSYICNLLQSTRRSHRHVHPFNIVYMSRTPLFLMQLMNRNKLDPDIRTFTSYNLFVI